LNRFHSRSPCEVKRSRVLVLTFDERFLYAAFDFADSSPAAIRAPFADRDRLGNGYNDYGASLS
jgi:hypothetical protein